MRRMMLCGALALLAGCGHGFSADQYPTPETLLAASKAAFRRGDFSNAQAGFQRATFELPPRDPALVEARFYLAECEYAQGDYLAASREFRRVSDDTPDHPLAPDALLRAGDALAELWRRPELDPTYGENAKATYQELMGRYPNSVAAQRARVRNAALSDRFALKYLETAQFYGRLKAYDSAILYYKDVVLEYPDSRYASTALIALVQTYRTIGYDDEATQTCAHLKQYYPSAAGLAQTCPSTQTPP